MRELDCPNSAQRTPESGDLAGKVLRRNSDVIHKATFESQIIPNENSKDRSAMASTDLNYF